MAYKEYGKPETIAAGGSTSDEVRAIQVLGGDAEVLAVDSNLPATASISSTGASDGDAIVLESGTFIEGRWSSVSSGSSTGILRVFHAIIQDR